MTQLILCPAVRGIALLILIITSSSSAWQRYDEGGLAGRLMAEELWFTGKDTAVVWNRLCESWGQKHYLWRGGIVCFNK